MKTCIILRGAPGAGKSTVASFIQGLAVGDCIVASADLHMDGWRKQGMQWSVNLLGRAHSLCKSQFDCALRDTMPLIIVDNTNTKPEDWSYYQYWAQQYGYQVMFLVVENRHGNQSVHPVPEATVEKYRRRIKENVQP